MVRRVFPVFLVFAFAACGNSIGPEEVPGTYTLQTVDGETLPVVLEMSTDFMIELTAGSVTFSAGTTCSTSFTTRETDAGNVTTDTAVDACTYTFDDGSIVLTNSMDVVDHAGSINSSELTLTDLADRILVYVENPA